MNLKQIGIKDLIITEDYFTRRGSYVESIPTYRVVLSEHKELRAALEALENARGITPNAWIAVY